MGNSNDKMDEIIIGHNNSYYCENISNLFNVLLCFLFHEKDKIALSKKLIRLLEPRINNGYKITITIILCLKKTYNTIKRDTLLNESSILYDNSIIDNTETLLNKNDHTTKVHSIIIPEFNLNFTDIDLLPIHQNDLMYLLACNIQHMSEQLNIF